MVTSILITLLLIAFSAWLPNVHLITKVMTSSTMTVWQKTNLLTSLLGSLQTNFTALSRSLTILSAILTGIQSSLLIYYVRTSMRFQKAMSISVAATRPPFSDGMRRCDKIASKLIAS